VQMFWQRIRYKYSKTDVTKCCSTWGRVS